jgi:hypothetical protein
MAFQKNCCSEDRAEPSRRSRSKERIAAREEKLPTTSMPSRSPFVCNNGQVRRWRGGGSGRVPIRSGVPARFQEPHERHAGAVAQNAGAARPGCLRKTGRLRKSAAGLMLRFGAAHRAWLFDLAAKTEATMTAAGIARLQRKIAIWFRREDAL